MASTQDLEKSLHADLSKRVLLLHYLSGWPSPGGYYAFCEVDLSADGTANSGGEREVQFVMEAIPGHFEETSLINSVETKRQCMQNQSNSLHAQSEATKLRSENNGDWKTVSEPLVSEKYEPLERFEEDTAPCSKGPVCSSLPNTGTGKMLSEEDGRHTLAKLSRLFPDVSIRAASYDALAEILIKLQTGISKSSGKNEFDQECPGLTSPEEDFKQQTMSTATESHTAPVNPAAFSNEISRHPNMAPILGVLQGASHLYVVYPAVSFTLQSLLYFSPGAVGNDQHIRFLIFQILAALANCHKEGINHGDLRPENILLTDNLWCLVTGVLGSPTRQRHKLLIHETMPILSSNIVGDTGAATMQVFPDKPCRALRSCDWRDIIRNWWAGKVSNYDYLLFLNKLAGRRWADPCFHTVMPWVIDFSVYPDQGSTTGWRDLTRSKWRLAKGDEQLDFTYASAEMPHHVSDECLSELAVCMYKARRLPLRLLRRTVRSVYEPNEYPANMRRLYQWTPDECIPEFFTESDIFESIHPGMNDLAIPTWSSSAEEFKSVHRAALESNYVSSQLHHWIDLTFGYKLSGEAAVHAKNVTLSTIGPDIPRSTGRRQLFSKPHPRRQHCHTNKMLFNGRGLASNDTLSHASSDSNSELGRGNASNILPHTEILVKGQSHGRTRNDSTKPLEALEDVASFSESSRHLSPRYKLTLNSKKDESNVEGKLNANNGKASRPPVAPSQHLVSPQKWKNSPYNVEIFRSLLADSSHYRRFVESLQDEEEFKDHVSGSPWCMRKRDNCPKRFRALESEDIFAVGCMIAELYLRKPLFNASTAATYEACGSFPDLVEDLPQSVQILVKSTLERDVSRRPSASDLLDSTFFSSTIRLLYFFLAPLHSLTDRNDRVQYVARMASEGSFLAMGHVAAEMCTPTIISVVFPPSNGVDVNAIIIVITKLLQVLKPHASKKLLIPVVQKLLQSQQSPALKVSILRGSFIEELWKLLGTAAYLQLIHLAVFGNLRRSPLRSQGSTTSRILINMSLNLGIPITLNQTVVPILQAFGRDITVDHIDVLIGLGEAMGEKSIVRHLLPPIRAMVDANVVLLANEGPGPALSWRLLAIMDAMAVLDRFRSILRPQFVLQELLQDPHNIYIKVLLQPKSGSSVLQCAARALLLLCKHVGPEAAVSHVLPQLKNLFDGLAFAGKLDSGVDNGKSLPTLRNAPKTAFQLSQPHLQSHDVLDKSPLFLTSGNRPSGSHAGLWSEGIEVEDDISLVYILYPGLASLVGIERLRNGLTTWLLLEQSLLKHCNWKVAVITVLHGLQIWEVLGASKSTNTEHVASTDSSQETVNPTNLLLDGVGWSTPLSQNSKWSKSPHSRRPSENSSEKLRTVSDFDVLDDDCPWSWVTSKGNLWDAESFGRIGAFGLTKDDSTWSLNSTILCSWKAHHGLVRCAIHDEDENTVFTVGGGQRGTSVVRRWRLATKECAMEYSGHEEAINDVCILPGRERLASCDGTIHIWNAHTGKRLALFDECSNYPSLSRHLPPGGLGLNSMLGENVSPASDAHNSSGNAMLGQSLTAGVTGGGLYSCMHSMEAEERLLGGMVNGALRFIDICEGRQLHCWRFGRTETSLPSFPSAISAIASSGQGESIEGGKYSTRSSWVAIGFNSGRCQVIDNNSGSVVSQWSAHKGFITKMYAVDEKYLVSSSLDRAICLWDLRKGSSPERIQVFRSHKFGITSFALKGGDVLSAAGSKIGLSSLSKFPIQGEGQQSIVPQKLLSADRGYQSISNISTIGVLPFSKLFLIGTEDGDLKICS